MWHGTGVRAGGVSVHLRLLKARGEYHKGLREELGRSSIANPQRADGDLSKWQAARAGTLAHPVAANPPRGCGGRRKWKPGGRMGNLQSDIPVAFEIEKMEVFARFAGGDAGEEKRKAEGGKAKSKNLPAADS